MSAPHGARHRSSRLAGDRLVETLVKGLPEVPSLAAPLGDRRVRCLVLPGSDVAPLKKLGDRVEVVEGDLTDQASVERLRGGRRGGDAVPLRGVIHPTRGTKQFFEVNTRRDAPPGRGRPRRPRPAHGARVVELADRRPTRQATHVFDESAPYAPVHGVRQEQDAGRTGGRGGERAVRSRRSSSARPGSTVPGQPPRQGLFFTMIKDGKAPLVGRGDNRRSMAYVDNICQGLLLCERVEQARGGIYWIADRRPYPMTEILDTVERVLEQRLRDAVRAQADATPRASRAASPGSSTRRCRRWASTTRRSTSCRR